MIKFPTEYGIGELRGDQVAARECYIAMLEMEDQDVFAWSHEDMPGIDPLVIVHGMNVNPTSSPIRQKKRVFA